MPKRIEKLKLTQFRGGSQPVIFDFKPDKSIVLIYGENGTGKSSIADAIDFVCNNEFGSLADRSGATPKQHVVSLHGQAKDVAVKIRYGGKDWEAKLQGGKPVTNPPDPPRAFILRRTDITRVMEAAPAERYKALQAYITVPNVESAERELRKAHKEMNARVERAESNRANALATLEKLWQAEGWPGGSPLAWAAAQTATGVEVQQQALDANRRLSEGIQQALAARSALQAAQQAADNAARTLVAAQAALAAAAAGKSGQSPALLALLADAQRYLAGVETGAAVGATTDEQPCPVCGQPTAAGDLLQRVETQLHAMRKLQELAAAEAHSGQQLVQAQGALRSAQAAAARQCRTLAGLALDAGTEYGEAIDTAALSGARDEGDSLAGALTALASAAALQEKLAAAIEAGGKTVHLWHALRTHLQAIAEAEHVLAGQQAVAQRLKAMLEVVEAERKSYVDGLVRSISGDVNALYARIHPHEPLGGSSLYVKPNAAGSLELRADFGSAADVAPGAYYSEAHLDTLGLCVYLALARRSGDAIVVLDDVLTSVDEEHLERIIQLLTEEAAHLGQLIITTHSRPWYERVRSGSGMNAQVIRLGDWNLARGIQHE